MQKEKKRAISPSSHSFHRKLLCIDCDDFTAIIGAASLAGSVGQTGLTALGASDDTGDRQLPVGVASLVSSSLGNFSLGYCHFGTPPWLKCRSGMLSTCSGTAGARPVWDPAPFCNRRGLHSDLFRTGRKARGSPRCRAACCPYSGQLQW